MEINPNSSQDHVIFLLQGMKEYYCNLVFLLDQDNAGSQVFLLDPDKAGSQALKQCFSK